MLVPAIADDNTDVDVDVHVRLYFELMITPQGIVPTLLCNDMAGESVFV